VDRFKKHNPQNYKLDTQHFSSIDELYSSISKEGSLGLLALGAQGLLLWRKKRAELEKSAKIEKQNER